MTSAAAPESILTDEELAWCVAHPAVPEARRVVELVGPDGAKPWTHVEAALAVGVRRLRAVRPRPPFKVRYAYALLRGDPGRESILCAVAPTRIDVLVAFDMQHLRLLMEHARGFVAAIPDLKVRRFAFDRPLTEGEVERLRPDGGSTAHGTQFFAVFGTDPWGDESMIGGVGSDGREASFCHLDLTQLGALLARVAAIRAVETNPVEIRRFVRDADLDRHTLTATPS